MSTLNTQKEMYIVQSIDCKYTYLPVYVGLQPLSSRIFLCFVIFVLYIAKTSTIVEVWSRDSQLGNVCVIKLLLL